MSNKTCKEPQRCLLQDEGCLHCLACCSIGHTIKGRVLLKLWSEQSNCRQNWAGACTAIFAIVQDRSRRMLLHANSSFCSVP